MNGAPDHEAISIGLAGQAICRILEVLDRARGQIPLAADAGEAALLEDAVREVEAHLRPIAEGYARACALMVGVVTFREGGDPALLGLELARLAELHDPRVHGERALRTALLAGLS